VTETVGAAARAARAAALDAWLAELLPDRPGFALLALGGLARRECLLHTDLDLLLVHDGRSDVADAADIWYPIWDAGYALDHAVRTTREALAVAEQDVKSALGMLGARFIAGDATLAASLQSALRDDWRRHAHQRLPALRELTEQRWKRHGELAFLQEGDVKEARGGLRDVVTLEGLAAAHVTNLPRRQVREAYQRLVDVREALHIAAGKRVDRLLLAYRAPVATLLGLAGPDALARQVSQDARIIAHGADTAWRAVDRWLGSRRRIVSRYRQVRRPLAAGVVEQDGEVVLARGVTPSEDPVLPLRVAAAAATASLPIAPATLEALASGCPPLPDPWPPEARHAFIALLGAGTGLIETWEACDQYGLVERWLPEWNLVRALPQHNPVHQYTVDRHLVQTAAEAAAYAREVDRPDLLLVAALLHDVGKGLDGDHSEVGAPIAARMAARIGLSPAEVELIERLVRLHLLLPEVATRRDIGDPVTITGVAEAVRDTTTLHLLHALARADARATGPAAWSDWKGRLIAELVRRVHTRLDTGLLPDPPTPNPALVAGPLPAVHLAEDRVAVAAADRRGLLAAAAGCLALHRLEVLSADASTVAGRALVEFVVQPRYGTPPDPVALAADLRRAVTGDVAPLRRLRGRVHAARGGGSPPRVVWHRAAATDAVVLELRAADSGGLLYRVATALDEVGAQVRAARIATLGGDVVDTFYLVGGWPEQAERERIEAAVLAAV